MLYMKVISNLRGACPVGNSDYGRLISELALDQPPVAVDDQIITLRIRSQPVYVLANDVVSDTLEVIAFSQPAQGSLVRDGSGEFVYTPLPDFFGVDTYA